MSEVPTPWWTLQHDIRLAGLDPTALRRVTDRGMAENLAAVADGTLDVAQVFEPFVSHGRGERHRRISGTPPPTAA